MRLTGYTFIQAEAGTISQLVITHRQDTAYWQGYYGLAVQESAFNDTQTLTARPSEVDLANLVFPCLQSGIENEIYASSTDLTTLDFGTAQPATTDMVDTFLNISINTTDSANRTFLNRSYFIVSGTNVSDVPITHTFVNELAGNDRYPLGILNISGELVFVTKRNADIGTNYRGW